jgi:hypothetical protein
VQSRPSVTPSSSLLARKGMARPAMRSAEPGAQAGTQAGDSGDDLGWNDMGCSVDTPAVPAVLVERAALKIGIETRSSAVNPVSVDASGTGRKSAVKSKGARVAFTLRLDADRRSRLRVASAATGCSAQALVTQALDAFLQSFPEVDARVARLPPLAAQPTIVPLGPPARRYDGRLCGQRRQRGVCQRP